MEELPSFARINFGEDAVRATRKNTIVYTHYGEGALYDHVFIEHDNGEVGAYVWKHEPPNNPNFEPLSKAAVEHGAEYRGNIQVPHEKDIRAFGKQATKDLISTNEIPEDWLL